LNELNEKLQILTGEKLIVRSSAIGEDADDFSFAGQLDSFVVENKIASVVDGVKKCWASLQGQPTETWPSFFILHFSFSNTSPRCTLTFILHSSFFIFHFSNKSAR
jgi:hypothetical protein